MRFSHFTLRKLTQKRFTPEFETFQGEGAKRNPTTALQSLLLTVLMFVTVATWPRHRPVSCDSGAPSKSVSLRRFCKARVILRLTDSICSIAVNLKINKYERCFSELRAAHQLCRREKNETVLPDSGDSGRRRDSGAGGEPANTPYHKRTHTVGLMHLLASAC